MHDFIPKQMEIFHDILNKGLCEAALVRKYLNNTMALFTHFKDHYFRVCIINEYNIMPYITSIIYVRNWFTREYLFTLHSSNYRMTESASDKLTNVVNEKTNETSHRSYWFCIYIIYIDRYCPLLINVYIYM